MDGQLLFGLLFGFILFAYVLFFLSGKHYLKEYFQGGRDKPGTAAGSGSPSANQLYPVPPPVSVEPPVAAGEKKGRVIMEYTTPDSVAKNMIQSLDDYEYNYVFQQENDRELSTGLRDKLMSQRPMDWAGLPPSAAGFQAGLRESFEDGAGPSGSLPDGGPDPYANVDGSSMKPLDTLALEEEERKVLSAYKAPSAVELVEYEPSQEAMDPQEIIHSLYNKKGVIPTVKHETGTNVYVITGVRRKDEKVVYEDEEAPAAPTPVEGAGEQRISVPAAATDMAAARDPFYDATAPGAGSSTRMGKWDYRGWTPGLERMFAPTNTTQAWY